MTSAISQPRRAAGNVARSGATAPVRLAAIAIGSNSFHMLAAEADAEGNITPLWRIKEMVGLGRATFPSHAFSRETIDRAVVALMQSLRALIRPRRLCHAVFAWRVPHAEVNQPRLLATGDDAHVKVEAAREAAQQFAAVVCLADGAGL